MKVRNIVINIPLSQIYPHPDNPRKNLGDLDELTDSIKKNGLMQNLTVMPGHWLTKEEYILIAKKEGVSRIDAEATYTGEEWSDEGYTLLIGHRRCAAARKAELFKVPCRIIEDITKNEQVGMMLEENMQRNDLTIYEQAEGFQMMLDLGKSVDSLAEKTGFSKTTIYHRTNLAKLDKEKLKKIEEDDSYQFTLKDLYELEKIKDVEVRNKILEKSNNSQNLKWNVEQQVKKDKEQKVQQSIEELFSKHNIPEAPELARERWRNNWEILQEFDWNKEPEIKIDITSDIMWTKYWNSHALIREKIKTTEDEKNHENRVEQRKLEIRETLEVIENTIKDSLEQFHQMIINDKLELGKDLNLIWKAMLKIDTPCDLDYLVEDYGNDLPDPIDYPEKYKAVVDKLLEMPMERQMLTFLFKAIPTYIFSKWSVSLHDNGVFLLKIAIEIFEMYGFSLSEEQQQFLNGKHPLFEEYRKLEEE